MTETQNPVPAPKKRRPFAELRVDAKKAADGVWIQHGETRDQLRCRRLWCAEHLRAIEQASIDYEAKHGPNSGTTAEGKRYIDAVAMAVGLIVDWRIAGDDERPYDPAEMTAVLLDPDFADLSAWVRIETSRRGHFQAEHVAGR
jgi:hypothetical protein